MGFKAAPVPNAAESLAESHGLRPSKLLVLWSHKHKTVLHDPMTGKPVASRHKSFLEPIAKEYHCEIIDLKTALARILKYQQNG